MVLDSTSAQHSTACFSPNMCLQRMPCFCAEAAPLPSVTLSGGIGTVAQETPLTPSTSGWTR